MFAAEISEQTKAAKQERVFIDAESVDAAKADMLMYDCKLQTKHLTTTYTSTLVGDHSKLEVVKSVLCASVSEPTNRQVAATLVIARAFKQRKHRVLFELPAGHGKSYLMLFVAGLLLAPPQTVEKVVLIYHEQEILAAEQPHIDIMQKHFGDKVSAITYSEFHGRLITLEADTLTIMDEADLALIDKRIKLEGSGLFLGLTATGLSHASTAEKYYLA